MSQSTPQRRQRGSHIYQRTVKGTRVWYAYLAGPPPERVSLRTSDRSTAELGFRALLAAREKGDATNRVDPASAPELQLREVFVRYLEAPHGWTHKTQDTTRRRLDQLGRYLYGVGVVYPSELGLSVLDRYLAERQETRARRTINRDLRALRLALRWGAERGLCRRNDAVESQKQFREAERKTRRVLPSPQEVALVIEQLAREDAEQGARKGHAGGGLGRRNRCAARATAALYATGLRIAELLRLTEQDLFDGAVYVSPEQGPAAHAAPTKGYRERSIPLAPIAEQAVRAYLDYVATSKHRAEESWLLKRIRRACETVGVPPFTLHDLRRSFATECHRAGVPVLTISTWLGHADVTTTELYLGVYRTDRLTVAPVPTGLLIGAQSVSNSPVTPSHSQSLSRTKPSERSSGKPAKRKGI